MRQNNQTATPEGDIKWRKKKRGECIDFCFPEYCHHIGKSATCPIFKGAKRGLNGANKMPRHTSRSVETASAPRG